MGQVSSLFAHKFIRQAAPELDARALLQSVGLGAAGPVDASAMVSDDDYYALVEEISRADASGIDLPLRVGATMRCDDYGAFGLAWKSAVDLRESFGRAERYARVLGSVASYSVEITGSGVCLRLHREGERRLGLRLSNEATIASIVSICREVSTAAFEPLAVHFMHESPGTRSEHEKHFACPVNFGSDRDALLLSQEICLAPNRLGDEQISRFFDTHLEAALAGLEDETSLEKRVRIQISRALSDGVPKVSDIARRLAMSSRTLQRRLSDQGYSYQALVDESRRQLAEKLLCETAYSLAEVAFLTGFSEQSAFNRAFRRWAGQTPRSFRLQTAPERPA